MPTATPPSRYLRRDVAHSLAVTALACAASGGLVYLAYLVHTILVAARARAPDAPPGVVLVFGKRLVAGQPDRDYRLRLARARHLLASGAVGRLILLGGPGASGPSEAAAGWELLREWGVPASAPVLLEDQSSDTLQNLRQARALLGPLAEQPVLLVTNRYHLARCAHLARQLGFEVVLCAAEDRLTWSPAGLLRLAREAGFLCWFDLGTRWARLIGHRRMVETVS